MGHPKHPKKSYDTPTHPWVKSRIEEERELLKEYGLKNKREIWKMRSHVKQFSNQAKRLIVALGDQAEKEKKLLFTKLTSLGFLQDEPSFDDVLGLDIKDIMDRRLQTVVYKKGLARSVGQARQFITHNHIMVNGKKMNVPGYIVRINEESTISFAPKSTLADPEHPERKIESESQATKAKEGAEEAKEEAEKVGEQKETKEEMPTEAAEEAPKAEEKKPAEEAPAKEKEETEKQEPSQEVPAEAQEE